MTLDPEFMKYMLGIYGNANLDGRTIKLLYLVWQTNPQVIINTYNLKNQPKVTPRNTSLTLSANLSMPTILKLEMANDDLSGITNFNDAFKVARLKGLKQFKWKSTKGNPSGIFGTELATLKKPTTVEKTNKPTVTPSSKTNSKNSVTSLKPTLAKEMPKQSISVNRKYDYFRIPDKTYEGVKAPNSWVKFPSTAELDYDLPVKEITSDDRWLYWFDRGNFAKYQLGGTMTQNSQQELLIAMFKEYLKLKYLINSDQELNNVLNTMDEKLLEQEYAQFLQAMQQLQVQAAKFGAKIDYIKSLRGQCPEGYETQYFKEGGLLCKKCIKKQMEKGGEIPEDPIDAFKCGGKKKKKSKKEQGGSFEMPTFDKATLAKCGAKLKEAACGIKLKKDACGSKLKKNACGSKLKKEACGGSVKKDKCGSKMDK